MREGEYLYRVQVDCCPVYQQATDGTGDPAHDDDCPAHHNTVSWTREPHDGSAWPLTPEYPANILGDHFTGDGRAVRVTIDRVERVWDVAVGQALVAR